MIYYDEDQGGPPTVMREPDFPAWYERWTREVIAGYDDEEMYFGLYLDGKPQELMELYEQTEDVQTRIEIVESCYKFQELPSRQKTYFKKACDGEQDSGLRMALIKMLSRFHVPGMAEQIDVLWDFGAYPEAISVICYEGGREEVLDYFLDYLPDEKNHERAEYSTLIYAIWVTKGIRAPRLERVWVALLDKFRTTQDARDDYRGSQLHLKSQINPESDCCVGASHPFGVICSNLMGCLDRFGLDYRGSWKLLMDNRRWADWKQEHGTDAKGTG